MLPTFECWVWRENLNNFLEGDDLVRGSKFIFLFQLWQVQNRERKSSSSSQSSNFIGQLQSADWALERINVFIFQAVRKFIQIHVQEAAAAITATNPGFSNWFIVSFHLSSGAAGTISNYAPLGLSPICNDFPNAAHKSPRPLRYTHTRLFDKPLSIRKHTP